MIIGSTGEGKSSLVNMIIRKDAAKVDDGVDGCTFECEAYKTEHNSKSYSIIDTLGLDGSEQGATPHWKAVKQLV
ncbi:unnamed protein product, partial [Rotaria sp. Silwood2]